MEAKMIIGAGVYTAADAHRILNIPYSKAKYWFKYYAKHKFFDSSNSNYSFNIRRIQAVNFLALMEMYIFYSFKEHGVKTSRIIEAHKTISEHLNTQYPFAIADLYLGNNKSLLFTSGDSLITADRKLQIEIEQILKPFIRKVEFQNGIAKKYYPLGKKKSVVVNPENQFGQPTIEGTNILTETIFLLAKSGEPVTRIAKLYDLTLRKVREAIEFSAIAA